MFTFNAFGADHEIGLTILGNSASWNSRLFCVYGPAPEGLSGKNGTRLIPDWKREIAGLSSHTIDVERTTDAPSVLAWEGFPVNSTALSAALKACMIVVDKDNPRSYGTVVAFQDTKAVATDGFRLTWTASGFNAKETLCLPAQTIKPLLAFLKKAGKEISGFLSEDKTSICFVGNGARFYARLSAVKFPAWEAIVPKRFSSLVSAEDVARVKTEAATKKKAAKKTEVLFVEIGGHTFNCRFVADLPDGCTVQLGETDDDPCLAHADGINMVLCPVRLSDEEKAKRSTAA